jgi:hypothetical protein
MPRPTDVNEVGGQQNGTIALNIITANKGPCDGEDDFAMTPIFIDSHEIVTFAFAFCSPSQFHLYL